MNSETTTEPAPIQTPAPTGEVNTDTQVPQGGEGQSAEAPEGQGSVVSSEGEKPEGQTEEVKPEGAPESYAQFTLPEGFVLEGERLTEVHEFAKANNWTQEQTQAAIDKFVGTVQQSMESEQTKLVEGWLQQTKADPEIGGAKLEASLQFAAKAASHFGGKELAQMFDDYGIGNHPIVIKTFARIGKLMSEGDVPGMSTGGSATPKPLHQRMYPPKQ